MALGKGMSKEAGREDGVEGSVALGGDGEFAAWGFSIAEAMAAGVPTGVFG